MGLPERVAARRRRLTAGRRTWPVGPGVVTGWDAYDGHDQSQFSPEEYGDSLATSNEVFSAVNFRARLMSGLDLRFYRGRGKSKKEVTAGPAPELYWRVNDFWSAERLARMDELSMGVWGQTLWAIEPTGPGGEPGEIWWLKPSRCKPIPHELHYLGGFLYEPIIGGDPIHFTSDEIVWQRYPNPLDEFAPLSPLAAAKLAAETASSMMLANRNLFTNGMLAGGLIVPGTDKVTFSPEQAEDLERQFARRMKGVDKAHRWAVLRYEARVQALNVSPKDAEFLGGLNMSLRQVCNAYGLFSPLLNDLEHATLANAREFERMTWSFTLVPDSQLRAAEIREQYLPRFKRRGGPDYCEFDYTKVPALQESASEAWARDAQALDRGLFTINEVRARLGMPPVPWGDEPWLPVNKAQVVDGQLQTPAAAPKLPDDEVNPSNPAPTPKPLGKPESLPELRYFDHNAARRLIAKAFGDQPANGHAISGR